MLIYGVAGEPKPLIEASTAIYLIGSDLHGVMSPVSKYAFSDKAKAEAVIAVAGGRLGSFAEAIAASLEDHSRKLYRRYATDRKNSAAGQRLPADKSATVNPWRRLPRQCNFRTGSCR